jgi:hypothetical protein
MEKQKLLEGRKLIEDYRTRHADLSHFKISNLDLQDKQEKLIQELFRSLDILGFKSPSEFEKFNSDMCYEEFKRCYKRVGECDGCRGRKRGCLTSCYEGYSKRETGKTSDKLDDETKQKLYVKGAKEAFDTKQVMYWKLYPGFVPHGCSVKFEKMSEPEFDFKWDFFNLGNYGNSNT